MRPVERLEERWSWTARRVGVKCEQRVHINLWSSPDKGPPYRNFNDFELVYRLFALSNI